MDRWSLSACLLLRPQPHLSVVTFVTNGFFLFFLFLTWSVNQEKSPLYQWRIHCQMSPHTLNRGWMMAVDWFRLLSECLVRSFSACQPCLCVCGCGCRQKHFPLFLTLLYFSCFRPSYFLSLCCSAVIVMLILRNSAVSRPVAFILSLAGY